MDLQAPVAHVPLTQRKTLANGNRIVTYVNYRHRLTGRYVGRRDVVDIPPGLLLVEQRRIVVPTNKAASLEPAA